jgi:osmotically-inducible protein OsmY
MKTDTQLQHDVQAELEWEPSVNASQIGVSAKDGVATLTGYVSHYAEKIAADRAAKRVYGVKAVANDIEVHLVGTAHRTDSDIASAAVNALTWDTSVPEDRVKVTVRNGWITLDGSLDWQYQKESAERAVRNLIGVMGVTNEITVTPRAKSSEVKNKIEAAFKRSAEVDARRISVEVREGKVVLHGHVRSWAEREDAQEGAWAAPGVSEVQNQLTVTP